MKELICIIPGSLTREPEILHVYVGQKLIQEKVKEG
jgi:hypothetical protein